MKKIIAVLVTVIVLITPFSLFGYALSQSISGSANNSTATFYVTVHDSDMQSCNGSFSVSGGTITSIAANGGIISANGNTFTYSGGPSATIVVSCKMTDDSIILTSNAVKILDGNNRVIGYAKAMKSDPVVAPTSPTTTTTTKKVTTTAAPVANRDDTTTTTTEPTTEETTTEEETSEDKTTTTTTTTEIVIAPTSPKNPNSNGGIWSSKLLVVMITLVATLILAFAIGLLLGKRRSESIKFNTSESIENVLGEMEDGFEESAD